MDILTPVLQQKMIYIFLLVMSFFLLVWNIPLKWNTQNRFILWLRKVITQYGFDNFWSLFAPEPPSQNFRIGFELEMVDGKLIPWKLTELKERHGQQLIRGARFLKWFNLMMVLEDVSAMEGTCRYIMREYLLQNPNADLPLKIHVNRYYTLAPDENFLGLPWYSEIVFSWDADFNDKN